MATQLPPSGMPAAAPSPAPLGLPVMGRPKAICPDASTTPGEHTGRAVSGCGRDSNGRDFYIYSCMCGRFWKQIRASQLLPGEVPEILLASMNSAAGSLSRKRGQEGSGYLCSRWHQPKKNHVCTAGKRPKQSPFQDQGTTTTKRSVIPDPIQVPVWFMELDEKNKKRSDILI